MLKLIKKNALIRTYIDINLNTSHVKVNQTKSQLLTNHQKNLNTSHVKVNL